MRNVAPAHKRRLGRAATYSIAISTEPPQRLASPPGFHALEVEVVKVPLPPVERRPREGFGLLLELGSPDRSEGRAIRADDHRRPSFPGPIRPSSPPPPERTAGAHREDATLRG